MYFIFHDFEGLYGTDKIYICTDFFPSGCILNASLLVRNLMILSYYEPTIYALLVHQAKAK